MRNQEQFDRINAKFKLIWEKYPDLLFGQFTTLIMRSIPLASYWYVTDQEFEDHLDSIIANDFKIERPTHE